MVSDGDTQRLLQNVQRFIDKELNAPLVVADVHRFTKTQGKTNFFPDFRWHCHGQATGWIAGRLIQNEKNDKADDQQSRNSNQQTPDDVADQS